MGEPWQRSLQDDRETPQLVLPDPDSLKLSIGSGRVAQQAALLVTDRFNHALTVLAATITTVTAHPPARHTRNHPQ
jgi:hypothetical protein